MMKIARNTPRPCSFELINRAIASASTNWSGTITTTSSIVNLNASAKFASLTIIRKGSIVHAPPSRNASSNACTIGHAKNSDRYATVGRISP